MGISKFQYGEMVARLAANSKHQAAPGEAASAKKGEDRESVLRRAITDFCAMQWPIWIAAGPRSDQPSTMPLGWPDLIIVGPHPLVLFIDLKSRTGKPSRAQLGTQARLRALGYELHFVRTFDQFLDIAEKPR